MAWSGDGPWDPVRGGRHPAGLPGGRRYGYGAPMPASPPTSAAILAERYASLIRAAIGRVLGAADDATRADVHQQVSVALWRAASEQRIEHPSTYVYRCAIREAVRASRTALRRAEEPLVEVATQPTDDPFQDAAARQLARAAEEVMATLPEERQLAVRAHLEGIPVDQLMALHGWSYQKARNLVARGMSDLRTGLNERGYR